MMGENIKLKDLYNEEQNYTNIGTIAVPKADGSGDTYYVQRPIINYTLQDPPTRELTDADEGAFAWNFGDGTVFEGDLGNFLGTVGASVAGKTTRPIVTISVTKHLSGATVNANNHAIFIYLYEELSGSVLLDVLGETGNPDFTAQVGWGQLLLADTKSVEITGYAKINDPGAVTIGIEQPAGYQKAEIFYSLLSEVTQEEQTVSVTENGEQTIVPTAGKSGIRKVALNVNVPQQELQEKSVTLTQNGTTEVTPDEGYGGMSKLTAIVNVAGGGGGVQPDWNQNDSTAADFVKNRPGAYYETTPELTFTYDGNPVGKTVFDLGDGLILVKVSDTDLPTKEQFKQSSNLLTVHSGTTGDTTVNLSSPFYYLDYYGAVVWTEDTDGTSVAFVPSQEVATMTGTEVGVYFGIASATEPSDSYISSFVCKGMKLPVELPEILTQVKQSDWGAVDGAASILNRIGGFFKTSEAGTVIEVADNAQWDYTIIGDEATKVLDYPLTAEELLMLQLTTVLDGGQEVTDALYLSNRLDNPTSDVYTLYRLNCIGVWVMKKSDHTALFTCAAIVSCYGSKTIPAGTYVVRKSANPNSYVKKVTTYSTVQQKLPGTLVRPNFIDQLVMAKSLILKSSSAGSNKTFLISVNDAGTLTATETILE